MCPATSGWYPPIRPDHRAKCACTPRSDCRIGSSSGWTSSSTSTASTAGEAPAVMSETESGAVDAVLVDDGELVVGERREAQGLEVVVELPGRARADERRGHRRLPEHPLQRQLGQRLPTRPGEFVEFGDALPVG